MKFIALLYAASAAVFAAASDFDSTDIQAETTRLRHLNKKLKKGATYIVPSDVTTGALNGLLKPGFVSATRQGVAFRIVGKVKRHIPKRIKHVGGLSINGYEGTLEIRNFWIEIGQCLQHSEEYGVVSAIVVGSGRNELFTFKCDGLDPASVPLYFNEAASLAITGDPDLINGAEAGVATVDIILRK